MSYSILHHLFLSQCVAHRNLMYFGGLTNRTGFWTPNSVVFLSIVQEKASSLILIILLKKMFAVNTLLYS